MTELTCIDIHLSQQRVSGILDNPTALSKGPQHLCGFQYWLPDASVIGSQYNISRSKE